uniref:Thymidylate synthase n=1 Tax=viral metagenome TaxID=1070528 RepID=A0A6C0I8T7_9ZZZZ
MTTLPLFEPVIVGSGFVKIVDVLPRVVPDLELKCDSAIVQAARVSYSGGTTTKKSDKALIKYLLKNAHTTPFEMVQFKFHIKAPLFVVRQWQRHRMSSYNELSARYSVIEDSFWVPETLRTQSAINKQGSGEPVDRPDLIESMVKHQQDSYKLYTSLLDSGVSRELARTVLPLSINTEFYWKIDLHNLLRFISLRNDNHAQFEIQQYASVIKDIVREYCPITIEAFDEYITGSIRFSREEINCMNTNTLPQGKSSQEEFTEKLKQISLFKERTNWKSIIQWISPTSYI